MHFSLACLLAGNLASAGHHGNLNGGLSHPLSSLDIVTCSNPAQHTSQLLPDFGVRSARSSSPVTSNDSVQIPADLSHIAAASESRVSSSGCLISNQSAEHYCLYSSSTFATHRGLSVLATPKTMTHLLDLPAFSSPTSPTGVNDEPNPPYQASHLPGKGIGLVANRTLHRGDRIFSKTPLYMVENGVYGVFELHARIPIQQRAIERLPRHSSQAFTNLCGHWGGDHVEDVINTNAFIVDSWEHTEKETAFLIVVPEISRMNHDCRPNTHYHFDTRSLTHNVHALRTIHPGEELTISYIDPVQPRQDRLERLHWNWGFKCACSSCTQSDAITAASDTRIQQIVALQNHLADRNTTSRAAPGMAELLVSLYEQERLYAPVAEAYAFAATEYNGAGDGYNAMKYASLAVEAGLVYGGASDGSVIDMKDLLEDPTEHWSWKIRRNATTKPE